MDWRTSINMNMCFFDMCTCYVMWRLYRIRIIYEGLKGRVKKKKRKKVNKGGKRRRKGRRRETWDLFVTFSISLSKKTAWKMAWFVAIDPLNSASRIKTVRETRYQISNQNVSGEKKVFERGMMRRETKRERERGKMEYIINEIFQDLFKLNSKWISSSFETF